jgi:hypothetical protein
MASRFIWHVLCPPIAFFSQRHAGDVTSRVAVNEEVARLLGRTGNINAPPRGVCFCRRHGHLQCGACRDRPHGRDPQS